MPGIICWLTINLGLTAIMWVPYILNLIKVQGLGAMGYNDKLRPMSAWAQRAKKAHYNAVENLALMAPAALAYVVMGGADPGHVQTALQIYFVCRVIHYLCYTFKVAYLRTLSFAAGWAA